MDYCILQHWYVLYHRNVFLQNIMTSSWPLIFGYHFTLFSCLTFVSNYIIQLWPKTTPFWGHFTLSPRKWWMYGWMEKHAKDIKMEIKFSRLSKTPIFRYKSSLSAWIFFTQFVLILCSHINFMLLLTYDHHHWPLSRLKPHKINTVLCANMHRNTENTLIPLIPTIPSSPLSPLRPCSPSFPDKPWKTTQKSSLILSPEQRKSRINNLFLDESRNYRPIHQELQAGRLLPAERR